MFTVWIDVHRASGFPKYAKIRSSYPDAARNVFLQFRGGAETPSAPSPPRKCAPDTHESLKRRAAVKRQTRFRDDPFSTTKRVHARVSTGIFVSMTECTVRKRLEISSDYCRSRTGRRQTKNGIIIRKPISSLSGWPRDANMY